MENRCTACKAACILVVIGAINWGLIGVGGFVGSDWNVVHMLLGTWPKVEWIVYILVGIAGIMKLFGSRCPCMKKAQGM